MNVNTALSPSLSRSGGDRNGNGNGNREKKPSATPTMTRAKNTSRRITVWMQQTWRERTIPSADFKGHNGILRGGSGASVATDASSRGISSPTGTPASKKFSTPPAHRNLVFAAASNDVHYAIDTEEAITANVDEALGAWTSLYKFEDQFPVMVPPEQVEIDDNNVDWILDGQDEWEEEYRRSRELLRTMYPGNSGNILSDLIARHSDGETVPDDAHNTTNDTNKNDCSPGGVDDDESLLLLKFGSAMGQQEYQFASFETANFSNGHSNPKQDETEQQETGGRVEEEEATNQTTNGKEGAAPSGQEYQFANFDAADFSNFDNTDEDRETNGSTEEECGDQNPKESNSDNAASNQECHVAEREIECDSRESQYSNRTETKTDEPLPPKETCNDSDVQTETSTPDVAIDTETPGQDEGAIPHTIQKRQSPPDNASDPTKDAKGMPAAAISASPDKNDGKLAAAASTTDDNFEEFWQEAIDAPTPETGTFPSFGSRSTYATSPLTSAEDGLLSPQSAFVARSCEVLECIHSQDGEMEGSDEAGLGGVTEGLTLEIDDSNDFGDFQDCSTPAAAQSALSHGCFEGDDDNDLEVDAVENDIGDVRDGYVPKESIGLVCQHEPESDRSVEEDQEDSMNYNVNASFETTETPLPGTFIARTDTGTTPLKKNGRCRTPTTPLETSPTSDHTKSEGLTTPLSHRLFGSPREGAKGRPPDVDTTLSEQAAEAAAAAAAIGQFTPVTRNFRYYEPEEDDSIDNGDKKSHPFGARTMMVVPVSKKPSGTPVRRFRLNDINKVMNGVPDEDSSLIEDETDGNNTDGDIKSEEEESRGGEESLLEGSVQSSSIPSVVQLFTKHVDPQRRSKIVVPNTVRATSSQGPSLSDSSDAAPPTNSGLSMPSFYLGRNHNSFSRRRTSSEIVSVSASDVASASASIMSMPMMKRLHRQGSSKIGSEKLDEPSINSSLASPEVKFLRRNKHKRILRNHKGVSSPSIHSRTSRTTDEGDDGTFDEPSLQRHYGDPRNDFYRYYYGHDVDPHDSDSDDLTDEESRSLGSLSTLPQAYWKHPELDHTLRELTKLEWDWLPYWQMDRLLDDFDDSDVNANNISLLQDQITNKLSKLDAFYGKICKKVYRKIQPHSDALLSANQAALDLHQNLVLSQMYLSRSQKSIALAKFGNVLEGEERNGDDKGEEGVGVHGALQLLEFWDTQQSYHELVCIEKVISEICDLESAISQKIQIFDTYKQTSLEDCDSILDMVTTLGAKLTADPANRLVFFDAARQRSTECVSEVLASRLHECLSDLAVEWCLASESSFSTLYVADGAAYSRLIEILIRVTKSHPRKAISNIQDNTPSNLVMEICTSIQTSLMLEIQKAFGKALLDPSDSEGEKSEYEQELAALGNNETYLDATRLPIWTHNLVTIRFEFEMKQEGKHSLPAIFHKLCLLLTNVLCGMHRLIEWHGEKTPSSDDENAEMDRAGNGVGLSQTIKLEIREELRARRASIWNACIQSIDECLEEYLKHSGKKKLFSKIDGNHDDSSWREDLEGLHDVSVLSHQFLSIRHLFLEGVPEAVINDGSRIEEKLDSCRKTHLRALHVEAMNTIGTMFYREDWNAYSFRELNVNAATKTATDTRENDDSVRSIVEHISEEMQYRAECQQMVCCRSRCNAFTRAESENHGPKSLLSEDKNPFEIDRDRMKADAASSVSTQTRNCWDDLCFDKRVEPLLELLRTYIEGDDDNGTTSNIVLKSVYNGVLPWTARLLFTIDKLPALAEEVYKAIQAIVDLYVTTAFRLCAGNGSNERILLGINTVQDNATNHQGGSNGHIQRSTSPPMFDFGLRSKASQNHSNRPAPVISPTAEAELSALVIDESDGLESLREFLLSSQKRLEGVAKLDLVNGWIRNPSIDEDTIEEDFADATARVLERRQAASSNHIFVALVLFMATQDVSSSPSRKMILGYTNEALKIFPLLMTLSNRISCMQSIRGRELLKEVVSVGRGWEESKLHEHANEYVEDFCNFLALLWHSLSDPSFERRLPLGIAKTLWENLLGGGYMVFLDGFSKVPYCSTEGRALMSMDVASFLSGTSPRSIAERLEDDHQSSSICKIPNEIRPYRTMAYVDTYIKMFYFPSNDAIEWIKTNYKLYHRRHLISLVINDRDAKKLTIQVMKCYNANGFAETIRV